MAQEETSLPGEEIQRGIIGASTERDNNLKINIPMKHLFPRCPPKRILSEDEEEDEDVKDTKMGIPEHNKGKRLISEEAREIIDLIDDEGERKQLASF